MRPVSENHRSRQAANDVIFKLNTMIKIALLLLSISYCCMLTSCDMATPQDYFEVSVLSCNVMHGFAGGGLERQLESPSTQLTRNGDEIPLTRKEIIDAEIQNLESYFAKLKGFKQTDDNRDMLQASLALYEYALPVYNNEYQQLAKLYDEGAAREQIDALVGDIETKYRPGFDTLFDRLTAAGKPYAARHKINVKWDVSTAPSS
jgi:hypothetical protein